MKQLLEILDRESGEFVITHSSNALIASTAPCNLLDSVPRFQAESLYLRGLALIHTAKPNKGRLPWLPSEPTELSGHIDQSFKYLEKCADIGLQFHGIKSVVMVSMEACELLIDLNYIQQYNNLNNTSLTVIPSIQYLIMLQSYQVQLEHIDLYKRFFQSNFPN